MFRAMRRNKQQLSDEECTLILENEVRGVLSVLGDNDYPYGIPINFYYSKDENKIYFHGARVGHKIDSIQKSDKVSFCVYDKGNQTEGKIGLDVKSVIVFGRIRLLNDMERNIDICRKLSAKFNFGIDYVENEIKKFAKVVAVLELTPEHITGKLINES